MDAVVGQRGKRDPYHDLDDTPTAESIVDTNLLAASARDTQVQEPGDMAEIHSPNAV